ncbi:hypothetical protein GPX89_14170 [Nocardia sp. ET3-3]|uniref:DUF3562 domain-containing protein n=1 Tax=Nocardia terrae TaxID=2675851 RepID=A0A7K1UVH2_9NOCA|nr:hypothetical protein [Nocardia terrae]MVU78386.1 hypothetical protein [Nocardia terrae]
MRTDEATQIQLVQDNLISHHPEVPASVIAEMVAHAREALTDARIRHFVPLLIERRARIELSMYRTAAAH